VNEKYKFPIFIGINGRMANCSSGLLGVIVINTFHFIPCVPLLARFKKKDLSEIAGWLLTNDPERHGSLWALLGSSEVWLQRKKTSKTLLTDSKEFFYFLFHSRSETDVIKYSSTLLVPVKEICWLCF